VKSQTTIQFRKQFAALPKQIQEQTRKAYRQFQNDPSHPSLRFKKVHPQLPIYSARINKDYRVVGQLEEDTVVWFWIGSHTEYDLLLNQF
jgi:mRNA-degrading endonuclease RelE of RelBE toxin-antitoxin system